jgi:hypothetical protein
VLVLSVLLPVVAAAQRPPIRDVGTVERVSTDSLRSVATAVPLPDGRVLLNDILARRIVLLDSTLSNSTVLADNTSATGDAYGSQEGTLIKYRGDSALFIAPASLSMIVITPKGAMGRVMAIPRPDDAVLMLGDIFGLPGFDAHGRLIYYGSAMTAGTLTLSFTGRPVAPGARERIQSRAQQPDSAFLARVDLDTRLLDTAAWFEIPAQKVTVNFDAQDIVRSITLMKTPAPVVDDWAVLSDGSIAVVRGRDYHVDWINADGSRTSSTKMPFDWQPLDEARKTALIDSAMIADEAQWGVSKTPVAAVATGSASNRAPVAGGGRSGGRGGGGAARSGLSRVPYVVARPALTDVTDYVPAFVQGAVHADADGDIWIHTSTVNAGRPVYDVVNRQGVFVDRVQLPPFRTIAGFGHGVVYMAVKDAAGVVHLERARIH